MASRMRVCSSCGAYALRDACMKCGSPTRSPHPARYSPQDPYGAHRRTLKRLTAAEAKASAAKTTES